MDTWFNEHYKIMAFSESFETKPEARKFYSQSKVSRLKSRFSLLKQRLLVEKLKTTRPHDISNKIF